MLYNDDDFFSNRQKKEFRINATIVISMIQITIQAVIMVIKGVSHFCILYYAGSKHTPSIKYHYHFHRLFNPIFLHGGNGHLLSNLLSQLLLCYSYENRNGTQDFLLLYFIAGIGGNIASALYFPTATGVGASGAIFGFLGYQLAYLIKTKQPQEKYYGILIVLCIQVLLIFEPHTHVDYSAHFGGFFVGILWYQKQKALIGLLLLLGCACIFMIDVPDQRYC
ncbi:unnamed protein product [Paramecium octaurelia]|uniref:Rhomboid-like protease n=1 Tax=Paramecium octaurelia TaxID=43137 RepID=A0A8S1XT61_PAROT|nr:unnamed protein product [Paramecium octaurelia]